VWSSLLLIGQRTPDGPENFSLCLQPLRIPISHGYPNPQVRGVCR
jgi:hypothetical protein